MMDERVSFKEGIYYALGDVGVNIACRCVSVFLFIYYTDVFKLSPFAVGTLFLVVHAANVFVDLAMGLLSDRTRMKYGKFRPWILWTAVPLAAALSLTFTCPTGLCGTGRLVYAYATYFLYTLVYSANQVPFAALLGVISGDERERASIGSVRMAGAYVGALIVQGLLPVLVSWFGTSASPDGGTTFDSGRGYSLSIYLLSVFLAVCMFLTFRGTRERVSPPEGQCTNVWRDFGDLVRNRSWLVLIVVGVLFNVYNAIRQGVTVFYFTHHLHRDMLVGGFLTALMIVSVVGALATAPLARRFGKRRLFVATLALAGLVNAVFTFCGSESLFAVFAIGVSGEFLAAIFPTLFYLMLGDAADWSERVNGRRATGIVFSTGLSAVKFGGGVSGVLIGVVLSWYGYQGGDAATIPGALPGILLLMGIFPSTIAAVAAGVMCLYPLKDGAR